MLLTPDTECVAGSERETRTGCFPIAIISNAPTPYRIALHQRIARELPSMKLHSVFTHGESNAPWRLSLPEEIGPVNFGEGEPSAVQDRLLNGWHEWRKGGRVIQFLRKHCVGFVIMGGYNDIGRIRVLRWCRKSGVPCFLFGDSNVLGDQTVGLKRWTKHRLVSWIVRQTAGVMVCGTRGRDYFARYGANPSRVVFFPYEPDYDAINSVTASETDEARRSYGLSESQKYIVYCGRLVREKRVDLLIRAFSEIAQNRSSWGLLIIGGGPEEKHLKALVPHNLRGRVIWAGFLDDQRMVTALCKASRVLVLPSDYEPWALVINEAAAINLAIIASDVVGAAAELVKDGVNGFLFKAGSVAGLTSALWRVTEEDAFSRMGLRSGEILRDWRARADPVAGLRLALDMCGIPSASSTRAMKTSVEK